MAGVKSVQMFHDVFHENSGHNKDDREGLSKLLYWNISIKNNMIINWYIAEMLKMRTAKTCVNGYHTIEMQNMRNSYK